MKQNILRRFFLLDIKEGMQTTLRHLFKKPITLQYPKERWTPYPRFRGVLKLIKDDEGNELCNACGSCQRICPVSAITVAAEGKGKERRAQSWDLDLTRCMFCGLCVEICPQNCLKVSEFYEFADYSRSDLILHKDGMYAKRFHKEYKK